jgi:hypothetical protein
MEEGITTKKKETLAFARAAQPQAASRGETLVVSAKRQAGGGKSL